MALQKSPMKHIEESSKDDLISNLLHDLLCDILFDRISNLPHDVLCHILSFLPTLDAISTSTLSSRWRNIWKDITKLNFDYKRYSEVSTSNPHKFFYFVEKASFLYQPKYLEKFSIRSGSILGSFDANKWVGLAIMRGIRSIDFCVEEGKYKLPSCIFNCKTLEELRLEGVLINIQNASYYLPNLKRMELQTVVFADDETVRKLVSSCTSLESLVVESVTWLHSVNILANCSSTVKEIRLKLSSYPPDLKVRHYVIVSSTALRRFDLSVDLQHQILLCSNFFNFESPEVLVLRGSFLICHDEPICFTKLRILKLVNVAFEHDNFLSKLICSCTSLESLEISGSRTNSYELNILSSTLRVLRIKFSFAGKLVIYAPALQYLQLEVYPSNSYEFRNLSSLEEADIKISYYSNKSSCGVSEILQESLVVSSILRSICNVKILTLTIEGDTSKLHVPEHAFPIFNRLTMLKLKVACCRWCLLFIKNSINLENIDMSTFDGKNHKSCWRNPMDVPTCLFSSFKSITINNYKNLGSERAMAKYFTEKAIMRKMKILASDSQTSSMKTRLQIKLLSRSGKCEILFCDA